MFVPFLLAAFIGAQDVRTLDLYRGASIEGLSPRYWAVEDTVIQASAPESNLGGDYTLPLGPGRILLIRFGNLQRIAGANMRVRKATLFLTPTGPGTPGIKSASRVLAPWGEGPMRTISAPVPPTPNGAIIKKAVAPRLSATWRDRMASSAAWEAPGAAGSADAAPITGVRSDVAGNEIAIAGLEGAVQEMIDHPAGNFGFALGFDGASEVDSSESPTGKPRLHLELEPRPASTGADLEVTAITSDPEQPKDGQVVHWTVHVTNRGDKAAASFDGAWLIDSRPGATIDHPTPLAPGAEATFTSDRTYRSGDPRVHTIGFTVHQSTGADALNVGESASPISLPAPSWATAQAFVTTWNEEVAAHSRFSFAPEGVIARIRLQGIEPPKSGESGDMLLLIAQRCGLQAPETELRSPVAPTRHWADAAPGLTGRGDTRFEGSLPGMLEIPNEPVNSDLVNSPLLVPTDLLGSADVATLTATPATASAPKVIILRVTDVNNRPLAGTVLSFFSVAATPDFTVKTNDSGTAVLPTAGLQGASYVVQAEAFGTREWTALKHWQLVVAGRRGSMSAAVVNLRFNVPGAVVDAATNLAGDKLIADSAGDLPAKLAPLIDGNLDTETVLPADPGSWVEVDLGRDRTIAEVRLESKVAFWSKFTILVYATGQRADEALTWAEEPNWTWTSHNRSDADGRTSVAYRNLPQRVRYLRIVNRSGGPGSLSELEIFGSK